MNTFDPTQWYSPHPPALPVRREAVTDIEKSIKLIVEKAEVAHVDIAPRYEDWMKLGLSLVDALGENGRSYFNRLSCLNGSANAKDINLQYDNCLKAAKRTDGITASTIFYLAKQAGIDTSLPKANPQTLNHSIPLQDTGEDPEDVELEEDQPLPTFYDKLKYSLPEFVQKAVDARPSASTSEKDSLVVALLTLLSGCLPGLHGYYDSRKIYTNLYCFVSAAAASGKGFLALLQNVGMGIHKKIRADNDKVREAFLKTPKEDRGNDVPPLKMHFIPANTSATAIYQTLADNDNSGTIFETEADTLTTALGQDWGGFSDGLRKAFHHEVITYRRRGGDEYKEVFSPKLSVFLSGTPKQVESLFPSVENGLFSRFIFYQISPENTWHNVFDIGSGAPIETVYETLGKDLLALYLKLKASETVFTLTSIQQSRFNKFFADHLDAIYTIHGDSAMATVKRLGVICFRVCMILTAIRAINDLKGPSMVCSDEDFDNALTISDVLLQHSIAIYSGLGKNESSFGSVSPEASRHELFFASLATNFTVKQAKEQAQQLKIPAKTLERWLSSGIKSKTLKRLSQGHYEKIV